ncbi:hypothetical protein D3C81_975470 [compost metagenome]
MVAVLGGAALGDFDDQVKALQLAQRGGHIGIGGQFAGKACIEHLGHGSVFEKCAQRHGQALQPFFFEKLPGMGIGLAGDRAQVSGGLAGAVQCLAVGLEPEQHTAGPAFAAGAQLVQRIAAQVDVPGLCQLARFFAVQGQVTGAQHNQPTIAAQVGQRQRGRPFAGGDQAQRRRRVMQQRVQVLPGGRGVEQVQVVEQQRQRRLAGLQVGQDQAPQVLGLRCIALLRRQLQRRVQVQQQGQWLVLGAGQAQPCPGPGQAAGELAKQCALAIAQRCLQEHDATFVQGVGQLLEQPRSHHPLGRLGGRAQLVRFERGKMHG